MRWFALKAGVKGATVRRDLATLSCLCSCAIAWDYTDTNPVRQFSKRHIGESPPRTTYPTADCRLPTAAKAMLASGSMTAAEVARQVGCSPSTLYRHVPGGHGAVAANVASA